MIVPIPKRVLVIDDDQAIRDLLCAVLQRRSFEVDSACNGEEGLARLREERYSIVLLDLMMPVVDGHVFLHRLRSLELEPRPIVLVISACDEPDLRKLERGTVSAIIRKPFDIFELADLVAACLGSAASASVSGERAAPEAVVRLPIAADPASAPRPAAGLDGTTQDLPSSEPLIIPNRKP